MNYKMIAIDLDDTLLRNDKTISVKSAQVLNEAARKGVKIILASGRTVESTYFYMQQMGLDFPVIGFQGAYVFDGMNKRVLHEVLLDCEKALPIIQHAETLGLHCNAYIEDKIYVGEKNKWSQFYKENFINSSVMIQVGKLSKFINSSVIKILIAEENEILQKVKPEFEKIAGEEVNTFFSQPFFLEFTNKKATKGYALKVLANHYGIQKEEIIAVGDTYNDISMIEYAGLGICMGNGVEKVKEIADFVTLGNEEDGVAYAVEKFLLS